MVLVFHQPTGNFTRRFRKGGRGGFGWWRVSEVTLGTSQNQKHVCFFLAFIINGVLFFLHEGRKKKCFVGSLRGKGERAPSVYAALSASPRLSPDDTISGGSFWKSNLATVSAGLCTCGGGIKHF